MEYTEIVTTVKDFLADEFEVDSSVIVDDGNLIETLELDSLDFVDLVVIIESNFGFKPTAEDFKGISTFKQFYDYIESRVNS